jgi:hypothetical protein
MMYGGHTYRHIRRGTETRLDTLSFRELESDPACKIATLRMTGRKIMIWREIETDCHPPLTLPMVGGNELPISGTLEVVSYNRRGMKGSSIYRIRRVAREWLRRVLIDGSTESSSTTIGLGGVLYVHGVRSHRKTTEVSPRCLS